MTAAMLGRRIASTAQIWRWQAGRWGRSSFPAVLAGMPRSAGRFCSAASDSRDSGSGDHAESHEAKDPGDALSVTGVRVYRNERPANHRTFRWGIGNKFRMINANRFMPVHKERPKEVTVREDYFESDNPNIVWEDLNECWEVYWYEHNKLNAKPFPVKKFGIEFCKVKAFEFYEELKSEGRLGKKREHDRSQEGIFYDERFQDWVAFVYRDGRPQSRAFSASKFGYEGARSLALAKQKDPVNGVLSIRRSSDGSKRAWAKKLAESGA